MRKPEAVCAAAVCLATLVAGAAAGDPPRLRGDPQAIGRIEKMLEQMGGAKAWADARSLYLEYRGWRTDPDGPLTERAWRDLREANQRIELNGPKLEVTWAFTPRSGWAREKAGVRPISAKGHAGAVADWPADFYTIIRSFAVADPRYTLEFVAPRRVVVKTASGAAAGWWEMDEDGVLVRWGTTFAGGETAEYVYGPMRDFGGVRFPAWGAATDGSWRFEYATVRLSAEPIPAALLQVPK